MNFTVRGEKIEVTDAIKEYAISKISKVEKYFDNPETVNVKVIFSVRGREQKVEVTINGSSYDLRAEVSHADMYAAIDLVLDKLETQMRKFKSKLLSKERVTVLYEDDFEDSDDLQDIVKRKKVFLKPMDEEEAIMQMELLGHTFYVYKDITSGAVSVLYKRYDGAYGVIETN